MERDAPRVSVIMCARDAERYIGEATQSVLAQSMPNFELIIVDDGSRLPVEEVLRWCEDSRVRIIRLEQCVGPGPARNRALRVARAPLVAALDADDRAVPRRLERSVGFLRSHPEIVLLSGARRAIADDGRPLGIKTTPLRPPVVKWSLAVRNSISHCTVTFRRPCGLEVGGYSESLAQAEDYSLWCRLAERHSLAGTREILGEYRLSPGGVSRLFKERLVADATQVMRGYVQSTLGVDVDQSTARVLGGFEGDPQQDTLERAWATFEECLDRYAFTSTLTRDDWLELLDWLRADVARLGGLRSHSARFATRAYSRAAALAKGSGVGGARLAGGTGLLWAELGRRALRRSVNSRRPC
jgi:glycosyltransferase involved in cell wall biosynthesis